ncbi:gag/pol protein [Cucumis melo var. makuwa]|uniref:Gag/pol protein n=1 Tax=Cucumis melo var. makuwa TaxID=1194695 RepID=A0A5D3BP54_CUCMM|nr:gag/pol protein [Cucumis melo var. makuwa]
MFSCDFAELSIAYMTEILSLRLYGIVCTQVIFSLSTLSVLHDNDAVVEIELLVPDTLPTSAESFRSNSRSAGIVRGDDVCWLHAIFRAKTAGGPGGDLPAGVKPIRCKWIYKRKRDSAGKVQTFKARLVAKWFDTAIKSYDFDQNVDEPCVYKKINKGKVAFLVLYVDDILLIENDVGYLIDAWVHLSKEQCPKTPQEVEDMRRIPYASAVGSLMYAMLCTRPSIYYAVEIINRYQSNPGLDHWTAVKIILKYLRRMRDYMVVKQQKKHWTVSNSKEPRSHKRGKHIERKYHLIREIVQRGDVIVTKISSKHNIVDPFTKTLTAKVFWGHLKSLGLRDMYIR